MAIFYNCYRLRDEIRSLATPESRDVDSAKKFYPSSKLRRLITKERVQEVLVCPCFQCSRRIELQHQAKYNAQFCYDVLTTRRLSCFNGNVALDLFALLIFIECPQFILPFIRMLQNGTLPDQPESLSPEFLKERVWPSYDARDPGDSARLADEFYWGKYKFSVGPLTTSYEVFDRNVILPFFNEQPLDEGAFGRVYSFEILDGYQHLLQPLEIHKFARKELRNVIPSRFEAERANLEFVRRLADPHLISIIKAYKHGDCFNLIFPCARMNLDSYLRDPGYRSPEMFNNRVESHPIWEQMLGITGALCKIHSCTVPGEEMDYELYGYHFDIKPANILIENSGKFVITDFGQANFKQKKGTSRVTGMGGTEAYAPPEIEQRDAKPNRKYDVWSLGCVLLEVCAFAVLRHDGVDELDKLKLSRSADNRREYESFYQPTMIPGMFEIKPQIHTWMGSLPNSRPSLDEEGRIFLRKMLEIAEKMLRINVEERCTSAEAYEWMSEIMRPHRLTIQTTIPTTQQVIPHIGETEIGSDIMPSLMPLRISIPGQQLSGSVRMLEHSNSSLTLVAMEDGNFRRFELGSRENLVLIPQYALLDESSSDYSRSHLVLASRGVLTPHETLPVEFFWQDFRNSMRMQSVLLGQEVRRSLSLNELQVNLSFKQRAKRGLQRKPNLNGEYLGKASAVQLWMGQPPSVPGVSPDLQQKSLSPRASHPIVSGPAVRRIVIVCARMFLTIPFTKAAKLLPWEPSNRSLSLHLVLMDKHAKSTFTASTIGANVNGETPSFPLDRTTFEKQENEGSIDCESLIMTFSHKDDVNSFYHTYRFMKQEWSAEVTEIENARRVMGPAMRWSVT